MILKGVLSLFFLFVEKCLNKIYLTMKYTINFAIRIIFKPISGDEKLMRGKYIQ